MATKQQIRNRKKWAKALRSGKYKQTKGILKEYDQTQHRSRYCCLGVACEVFPTLKGVESTACKDGSFETIFGLDNQCPFISMNDGQNKSFKEIADYIDTLSH